MTVFSAKLVIYTEFHNIIIIEFENIDTYFSIFFNFSRKTSNLSHLSYCTQVMVSERSFLAENFLREVY